MGALSLDGSLNLLKGALPIAIKAKEEGFKGIVLPKQNLQDVALLVGGAYPQPGEISLSHNGMLFFSWITRI